MLKQKPFTLFLIFAFVVVLLSANCSKDDDNKNPAGIVANEVVGTWELTQLTIATDQTITVLTTELLSMMGAYWTLKFNNDQTFESNYNLDEADDETGTWEMSGEDLTVNFEDGATETFECSITDNILTLTWNDVEDGVVETLVGEFAKQ